MDQPGLTLVGKRDANPTALDRDGRARQRFGAIAVAATLLVSASAATTVGVDTARRAPEPREVARAALQLSLERGVEDGAVREGLVALRRKLGQRPLDSGTRVVYAALLLNLGQRLSDARAAAHHAGRAADLAPVTVPTVRLAVLTLTRTGDEADALSRIRAMFAYDPSAAADLLAEVEPLLTPSSLELGLADDPDAWYAWAAGLRSDGRHDEAYDWNLRAHARWPDHLPTLRFVVARAVQNGDWGAVAQWLPADLPAEPEAAPLLTYRARLKAVRGDDDGARDDIRRALGAAPGSNLIRILAGEAFEALGDVDEARLQWNRALYQVPKGATAARRNLLTRLARLEDNHGRPSVARKLWRTVLELDPSHPEATGRVQALSSFDR